MKMQYKNSRRGFTLVELVIVIAVIGILAAVLIPTFAGVIHNAKVSKEQANAHNLSLVLATEAAYDNVAYYTENRVLAIAENNGYTLESPVEDYYYFYNRMNNSVEFLKIDEAISESEAATDAMVAYAEEGGAKYRFGVSTLNPKKPWMLFMDQGSNDIRNAIDSVKNINPNDLNGSEDAMQAAFSALDSGLQSHFNNFSLYNSVFVDSTGWYSLGEETERFVNIQEDITELPSAELGSLSVDSVVPVVPNGETEKTYAVVVPTSVTSVSADAFIKLDAPAVAETETAIEIVVSIDINLENLNFQASVEVKVTQEKEVPADIVYVTLSEGENKYLLSYLSNKVGVDANGKQYTVTGNELTLGDTAVYNAQSAIDLEFLTPSITIDNKQGAFKDVEKTTVRSSLDDGGIRYTIVMVTSDYKAYKIENVGMITEMDVYASNAEFYKSDKTVEVTLPACFRNYKNLEGATVVITYQEGLNQFTEKTTAFGTIYSKGEITDWDVNQSNVKEAEFAISKDGKYAVTLSDGNTMINVLKVVVKRNNGQEVFVKYAGGFIEPKDITIRYFYPEVNGTAYVKDINGNYVYDTTVDFEETFNTAQMYKIYHKADILAGYGIVGYATDPTVEFVPWVENQSINITDDLLSGNVLNLYLRPSLKEYTVNLSAAVPDGTQKGKSTLTLTTFTMTAEDHINFATDCLPDSSDLVSDKIGDVIDLFTGYGYRNARFGYWSNSISGLYRSSSLLLSEEMNIPDFSIEFLSEQGIISATSTKTSFTIYGNFLFDLVLDANGGTVDETQLESSKKVSHSDLSAEKAFAYVLSEDKSTLTVTNVPFYAYEYCSASDAYYVPFKSWGFVRNSEKVGHGWAYNGTSVVSTTAYVYAHTLSMVWIDTAFMVDYDGDGVAETNFGSEMQLGVGSNLYTASTANKSIVTHGKYAELVESKGEPDGWIVEGTYQGEKVRSYYSTAQASQYFQLSTTAYLTGYKQPYNMGSSSSYVTYEAKDGITYTFIPYWNATVTFEYGEVNTAYTYNTPINGQRFGTVYLTVTEGETETKYMVDLSFYYTNDTYKYGYYLSGAAYTADENGDFTVEAGYNLSFYISSIYTGSKTPGKTANIYFLGQKYALTYTVA